MRPEVSVLVNSSDSVSDEDIRGLREEFPWLDYLPDASSEILATLHEKEQHYRGSWQKRGGVGAFMMLARKWDRIENISSKKGYDILSALVSNEGDLSDDVDDLIGYLLLVRAEAKRRQAHSAAGIGTTGASWLAATPAAPCGGLPGGAAACGAGAAENGTGQRLPAHPYVKLSQQEEE